MSKNNKTAMAKTGSKDIMVGGIPDYLKEDMESNAGNENVGADDILVPRLKILQGLSPETIVQKEEYVDGAEPGMFFNTLTSDVMEGPIKIVPFAYEMSWPVFKKRTEGSGFFGSFSTEKDAVEELRKMDTPSHYEVVQTAVHWAFVQGSDGKWMECTIHMSSTKLAASRKLNSLVDLRGGSRWTHIYELSTKFKESDKGPYFNLLVGNNPEWPEEALVEKAKKFHKMFLNKDLKTNPEGADAGAGMESSDY